MTKSTQLQSDLLEKIVNVFDSIQSEMIAESYLFKIMNETLIDGIGCSQKVAADWIIEALDKSKFANSRLTESFKDDVASVY